MQGPGIRRDTIAGMRRTLAAALVFLVIPLQSPFVSAEATALRIDGDMIWVEVRVETDRAAATVLVRAVGPDNEPLEPIAMAQGESDWSTRLFLPRRSDIRLMFEHLDPEGFSIASAPAALIELGVDIAVFSLDQDMAAITEPDVPEDEGEDRSRWGWLAIGLAAAAIALVLLAFGPQRAKPRDESEDG